MKKSLGIIMAAATAFSLSACNDDQSTPGASADINGYDPQRLISLNVPVSRQGTDFTVSVNAYCNTVPKNDSYPQNCSAAATQAMEDKFMCDSFALAAANTRSNSEAVIGAGLQGNYESFPRQYLFTQEELEDRAVFYSKEANQEDLFVITAIDNLEAASVNFTGDLSAPEICAPQ